MKSEEKTDNVNTLSSFSKEISVNEPDKVYHHGEEPKIYLLPKKGGPETKLEESTVHFEVLAEEKEGVERGENEDFQIMYDDEKKEYVLKKPMRMNENGVIDSWNGGDSKEFENDETRRLLENEDENERNLTAVLGEQNFTHVNITEEELNLEGKPFVTNLSPY